MDRKIVLWGAEDQEQLTHTEMDDAIESALDGMDDINNLPETLVVCGFARMELPSAEHLATHALERILEELDEEHCDPDGNYTEETEYMKKAAIRFATSVLDEYTSWACEIVKRETIDVKKWIKENRPEWLEENNNDNHTIT